MLHNFRTIAVNRDAHFEKIKCLNCNVNLIKYKGEDITEAMKRDGIKLDGCGIDHRTANNDILAGVML